MFSLFRKSDSLLHSDKVWKTRTAMLGGAATDAVKALKELHTVILISWFDDKRQSLLDFFSEHKVPLVEWDGITAFGSTPTINMMQADVIGSSSAMARLMEQSKKNKIVFIFDGHYPLLKKENDFLEKLKSLGPSNVIVVFCQSLDGALMKQFGGEKMVLMLEQLGLKDDECIEHTLVTKSIARAREKLTGQVTNEMSARREEEWYSKNVRSLD